MSNTVEVLQIIYNEKTASEAEAGFGILNNMSNERPDWYEYWPIGSYFDRKEPDNASHYGFFSPKFRAKTGLSYSDIEPSLQGLSQTDVILLSPFLDVSALYLNQIIHGELAHPGLMDVFSLICPRQDSLLVQTTQTTVFCNYFVAGGAFWRTWLKLANKIFALAEAPYSRAGKVLNAGTRHDGRWTAPMKVFCVERLAGIILADDAQWQVSAPFALEMPMDNRRFEPFRRELIDLDGLKKQIVGTGELERYIPQFRAGRDALIKQISDRV
jgi:hypothetical protein